MFALFAQGAKNLDKNAAGIFGGVLAFYAVLLAVGITIHIFFLLSVSKCLKECSPRNQKMPPGQVWLCLIPIFGLIWAIIMILRVSESLQDEYDDRDLRGDGDFGKTVGFVYIIGSLVCGPVGLIGFIMYWMKIAGFTKRLKQSGSRDDDEDFDDAPRKKKRRDDDFDDDDDAPRPKKKRRDDD